MKTTYWEFAGVYCYCTAANCYWQMLKLYVSKVCEKKEPLPY